MHHLSIDIETYSPEPIAKTGLYKYAQHPDFKILLFGYSLDGEPPIVIDMTQPGAALDYTTLLGPLVVVLYIIGELGSLAEHGVNMGAKVPPWLVKLLAAGKNAVDAAGDKLLGSDEEPPA